MSVLRLPSLAAMAHADLTERVRRPAFVVTLGFALWAAALYTPPANAPYATLEIDGHRGLYNSAWIGVTTAILCSVFFSFAGFYLVRSAVQNDRRTGVGAILATTPMSRVEYTLAKWLANFGVLAAMTLMLAVGAAAMQLARGEDRHLDVVALLTPFLLLSLPAMAIVSGVAVLFETLPWLNGGLGNVVFFFGWITAIAAPAADLRHAHPWLDPLGANVVIAQMVKATVAAFPGTRPESSSVGLNFKTGGWHLTTFRWPGAVWTPALIASRGAWTAVGALIAMIAALPFDRFANEGVARKPRRAPRAAPAAAPGGDSAAIAMADAHPAGHAVAALPAIEVRRGDPGLARLIAAELRLLLKGLPIVWYLVPLGLVVASAFVPAAAAGRVAAVAWVWPVLRWSALGNRDRLNGTEALLLSSPRPIGRQLIAGWLAGALLALAMGAGLGARALAHGDLGTVVAVVAGAAFVPAMAMALGGWTGTSKAFEALYLVLWYGGPLNGIPFLDFSGGSGPGAAPGFAVAAAALLALAALARRRRLQN